MKVVVAIAIGWGATGVCGCGGRVENDTVTDDFSGIRDQLENRLKQIADDVPGQLGVAVIVEGRDTMTLNNSSDYPLMSMFKLQEALAVCHILDERKTGLDTIITIDRRALDMETWSPMVKEYVDDSFSLSVERLLRYILIDSDNNASNLLFDSIMSPVETDLYIRSAIPAQEFSISHRESDMKRDIAKSYENCSSPLAYAVLVDRIFNDSIVSVGKQEFIRQAMYDCETGADRIKAGLPKDQGIGFAHRTGSGYVNSRGEIVAVNDGGYVTLPSGKSYSIAVFIKDYAGCQEDAEKVISRISKAVYEAVAR